MQYTRKYRFPSIKARSQSTLESQQYLIQVFIPFTLPISVNLPAFSPPASFILYITSLWGHLSSKLSVFRVLVLLSKRNNSNYIPVSGQLYVGALSCWTLILKLMIYVMFYPMQCYDTLRYASYVAFYVILYLCYLVLCRCIVKLLRSMLLCYASFYVTTLYTLWYVPCYVMPFIMFNLKLYAILSLYCGTLRLGISLRTLLCFVLLVHVIIWLYVLPVMLLLCCYVLLCLLRSLRSSDMLSYVILCRVMFGATLLT